jgi:DNA-binding transcriptional LysR family regulator
MELYAARMSLKVLPVKLPTPEWPTVLVTLKNRTVNPAVKLFMDAVRAHFKPGDARPARLKVR